jgi:uncharacterized protein YggE
VTGAARRELVPDLASWGAVVEVRAETQRDAFAGCSAALAALRARLADAAAAHDEAQVASGGVSVVPEWDERGRRQVGWSATGSVRVRAALAAAADLGQVALDGGAVRLDGPWYEVSGREAIREELLAEAVHVARRVAERIAGAEGRGVGAALHITHRAGGWAPFPGPVRMERAMVAEAAPPPLEPGAMDIEATVRVTFALGPPAAP